MRSDINSLFDTMPPRMLAGLIANGFDLEAHRAGFVGNDGNILQEREGVRLDEVITQVAQQELNIYADFTQNGMVHNLGSLGVMLSQWEKRNPRGKAKRSMSVLERAQNEQTSYDLDAVPIPVIFDEFSLDLRTLTASRDRGQALDTVSAQDATRNVAESVEDLIVNGDTSISLNGQSIPGLVTHTSRITGSLTARWDNSGTRDPKKDILAIKQKLFNKNQRGRFMIYANPSYGTALLDDYNSTSGKTLLDRVLQIDGVMGFKTSPFIPDGAIVCVVMQSSTVDFAEAQSLISVPWEEQGGLGLHQKIMLAGAPRFRPDTAGQLGVAHFSA